MSSALSAVTYTFVYTDSEPGRVFWGANEELSDGGSCGCMNISSCSSSSCGAGGVCGSSRPAAFFGRPWKDSLFDDKCPAVSDMDPVKLNSP
nr:hypothetical protein [Tanacetum cinerariifolium]